LRQLVLHRHKLVLIRARVKNELQHLSLNKGMQRKRRLWSQAGLELLQALPLKPWAGAPAGRSAGAVEQLRSADRQAGRSGAAGGAERRASPVADDPAGSGTEHGAGVRAHGRRCQPLSARQAGGELPGADSARRKLRRTAEAGSDHEARQSSAALALGYDPQFRKQYWHRCHSKPKGVAKVAAARKLAIRLYWMLRTQTGYPDVVRIESSSRVALVGAS